jgi:hypothetical protein
MTDLQANYTVFRGQKYRSTSKVQGVPWSEVPSYKQSTGCSLVRSTELQANYRGFLGQKYRSVSKVQDAAPAGTTSGVYEIDKFLKAELQAILMSVYRVSEWRFGR